MRNRFFMSRDMNFNFPENYTGRIKRIFFQNWNAFSLIHEMIIIICSKYIKCCKIVLIINKLLNFRFEWIICQILFTTSKLIALLRNIFINKIMDDLQKVKNIFGLNPKPHSNFETIMLKSSSEVTVWCRHCFLPLTLGMSSINSINHIEWRSGSVRNIASEVYY